MMKTKVLYIEDEPYLGKIVAETLTKQGFDVRWETDGIKVMEALNEHMPDICVLDIMLPKVNGYELCAQIKDTQPELPVIFLTAKTETADLAKGFEAGGSDYIRKPFSIEELIIRMNNQLKQNGDGTTSKNGPEQIALGTYRYNKDRFELHAASGIIQLSMRENEVLSMLVQNRNKITQRKNILLKVWGDDSYFNSRNLDVYINKLRDYFKEDPNIKIQTLKGKGYLFLCPS
jgi:DNA-binding response OmpR family regulator